MLTTHSFAQEQVALSSCDHGYGTTEAREDFEESLESDSDDQMSEYDDDSHPDWGHCPRCK